MLPTLGTVDVDVTDGAGDVDRDETADAAEEASDILFCRWLVCGVTASTSFDLRASTWRKLPTSVADKNYKDDNNAF